MSKKNSLAQKEVAYQSQSYQFVNHAEKKQSNEKKIPLLFVQLTFVRKLNLLTNCVN